MKSKLYYPRNVSKAFDLARQGKILAHTYNGRVVVWIYSANGTYASYILCSALPKNASCFFSCTRLYDGTLLQSGGITFRAPAQVKGE